jgi:hypothetical protein
MAIVRWHAVRMPSLLEVCPIGRTGFRDAPLGSVRASISLCGSSGVSVQKARLNNTARLRCHRSPLLTRGTAPRERDQSTWHVLKSCSVTNNGLKDLRGCMTSRSKQTVQRKPLAKSARERKQAFDERHLNRGRKDPSQPERWAVMVYLTSEAKERLAAIRRGNRTARRGPTTNSEIVEGWLLSKQVNVAGRVPASASPKGSEKSISHLLKRVDSLFTRLKSGDIGVFSQALISHHEQAQQGWSIRTARDLMDSIQQGVPEQDLMRRLSEAIDDYVHALVGRVEAHAENESSETGAVLDWVRSRIGVAPPP